MCCSSGQRGLPYLWSTYMGSTDRRQGKLLCLDLVNEFNTGDREGRRLETLEP